jgi:predicted DNA-binding protein (MmcQ/YjbR family)
MKGNVMSVIGAETRIRSEVGALEGVTSGPQRYGGVEFMLGSREIGHIHGDSLVDVPLPKRIRDELVTERQAEPHHVLPKSGWISVYLNEPGDVERAIWILRRSYDIAREQVERRAGKNPGPAIKADDR